MDVVNLFSKKRSLKKISSIHWKWISLFSLWLLFLSGFFASFLGSPGILQAIRLNNLLESKHSQLSVIQNDVNKLQTEAHQLESSRIVQEREVRRILGYAATDEIIFDFSAVD